MKLEDVAAGSILEALPKEAREMMVREIGSMTEVCSLGDRGEPQERDVLCTRPGPWGNAYTVHRHGYKALDLYRHDLRRRVTRAQRERFARGRTAAEADNLLIAMHRLAGKRLLCACPADSLACHVWILAEEVERLTGVPVKPDPGRERA